MKKTFLFGLLCMALGIGNAWAGIVGSTNAALFTDPVDWCLQYGCANNYTVFPTPQPFSSAAGNTGMVGLVGTGQGFYNLQEGVTWNGQFANGQGILYNGALFGNTPADFAATFDEGLYGAGAYVQSDYYGPFSATIQLFDSSYQLLGSFTTTGISGYGPGTALFIGAYDSTPDVWAVELGVVDQFGINDIAMGTMGLDVAPAPEPSTLLLLGSSLLGLLGFARPRMGRKN